MNMVDAIVCFHPAAMCELYLPFNRTLLIIASTRYELTPVRWLMLRPQLSPQTQPFHNEKFLCYIGVFFIHLNTRRIHTAVIVMADLSLDQNPNIARLTSVKTSNPLLLPYLSFLNPHVLWVEGVCPLRKGERRKGALSSKKSLSGQSSLQTTFDNVQIETRLLNLGSF